MALFGSGRESGPWFSARNYNERVYLMTLADNVDNVHKVVTLTISGSDSSGGAGIQVHLHYFFEAELY